ncbi:MAG: hypothetical protein LBQ97_05015 [Fusobacteriaceae bacterium]|jgi:hypothetical protein|nr:hypothetical protein [Fusobacteriaceae bacterium]
MKKKFVLVLIIIAAVFFIYKKWLPRDGEEGVYTEQGDVIWNHIKKIYPDIHIHIAGSVSGKRISEFLAERKFPLVRVKVHKSGYQHWLLIVGVKNNEFMCLDSLDPSKQPVPLSVHGKVYSWRVLYF